MTKRHLKFSRLLGTAVGAVMTSALAHSVGAAPSDPVALGKAEFLHSCAVCHGNDGQGGGPMATGLKKPPSNLTLLSKKNGGSFPFLRVMEAIDGRMQVFYHGPREMPVWGERYSREANPNVAQARILDLMLFLQTIQIK